ncbi:MAG: hypothetical protein HQM10_06525 [Candidatus Riflebacteria bacterium]|nr:hypothetical protein [Candidatus Riflebacteria bacterium]
MSIKSCLNKLCFIFLISIFLCPEVTFASGIPCNPLEDLEEVFLLPQWDKIPYKNQQESKERIEEVNKLSPTLNWRYSKYQPVFACISFAAATVCDWWAIQYGWKHGSYTNFFNGKVESGFNPRVLEAEYVNLGKKNPVTYPIIPFDLVHKTWVPATTRGIAHILASYTDKIVTDPILPNEKWEIKAGMYPIEEKWIFNKRLNFKNNDDFTFYMIRALHHYGIIYTMLEYIGKLNIIPGTHCVSIIGYGKTKDKGETVFIIHDNYGNNPKDYKGEDGKPAYRYADARAIESVISFLHKPVVRILPEGNDYQIFFQNAGGQPIKILRASYYSDSLGKEMKLDPENCVIQKSVITDNKIKVYVEAEFYMSDFGKGYWLDVFIP